MCGFRVKFYVLKSPKSNRKEKAGHLRIYNVKVQREEKGEEGEEDARTGQGQFLWNF